MSEALWWLLGVGGVAVAAYLFGAHSESFAPVQATRLGEWFARRRLNRQIRREIRDNQDG